MHWASWGKSWSQDALCLSQFFPSWCGDKLDVWHDDRSFGKLSLSCEVCHLCSAMPTVTNLCVLLFQGTTTGWLTLTMTTMPSPTPAAAWRRTAPVTMATPWSSRATPAASPQPSSALCAKSRRKSACLASSSLCFSQVLWLISKLTESHSRWLHLLFMWQNTQLFFFSNIFLMLDLIGKELQRENHTRTRGWVCSLKIATYQNPLWWNWYVTRWRSTLLL